MPLGGQGRCLVHCGFPIRRLPNRTCSSGTEWHMHPQALATPHAWAWLRRGPAWVRRNQIPRLDPTRSRPVAREEGNHPCRSTHPGRGHLASSVEPGRPQRASDGARTGIPGRLRDRMRERSGRTWSELKLAFARLLLAKSSRGSVLIPSFARSGYRASLQLVMKFQNFVKLLSRQMNELRGPREPESNECPGCSRES